MRRAGRRRRRRPRCPHPGGAAGERRATPATRATDGDDRRGRATKACAKLAVPPLALAAEHEQQTADDDRAAADPDREVDGLLLLHRKLERPELRGGLVFRVREAAVAEHERADHDEDDADQLGGIHGVEAHMSKRPVSRSRRFTSAAPAAARSAPWRSEERGGGQEWRY